MLSTAGAVALSLWWAVCRLYTADSVTTRPRSVWPVVKLVQDPAVSRCSRATSVGFGRALRKLQQEAVRMFDVNGRAWLVVTLAVPVAVSIVLLDERCVVGSASAP
jgi:hypothetical protein